MHKNILTIFILYFLSFALCANDSCSRTALINHQRILVDSSSSIKGDGLKFYLTQDPVAKQYFEIYQEKSSPSIGSAIISTAGLATIVTGFLTDKEKDGLVSRNSLIGIGIGAMIINFFVSKSLNYANEKNLEISINEYNKRNEPKINFSPFTTASGKTGVNLNLTKEF
jgi:hypothetical protein